MKRVHESFAMRALSLLLLSGNLLAANHSFAAELAASQVLKIGNGTEPKLLDPAKATGVPESRILYNMFEGLTSVDPMTLEPIPGAAESWESSKDGLTYTFKLRKDAKWSDGAPLTAEDFVKSWRRAVDPALLSEYAYQLYAIKNAEAINLGKEKDLTKLGVKAKDAQTLVVELDHPSAYFLRLTSFYTLFPTPAHVIAKFPDQEWTKEGHMVSNGPFIMTEWKINKHVRLKPNPHYWDKSRIKLQEVVLYPIEQLDTEEKTFFAGDLHMTNDVPALKIPAYRKEMAADAKAYHPYQSQPYLGTYFYRFNTTKKPLDNPKVRRALALTIDRTLLVSRVTMGGQTPAGSFTPPDTAGYNAPQTLPPSVTPETIAEAKKLLTEAGFPDGKGMPKLEILYNTQENHKRIAIALTQMWKKNLGIEVGLFNQEWKVYLDTQRNLRYDMSRAGWIGDYADPNTFLNMFVTGGGNNQTGWSNKEYDDLIRKADRTQDQQERTKMLLAAEAILMRDLPILPLYFYTTNKLASEKLMIVDEKGKLQTWKSNIQDLLLFKYYALAK